MIGPRNIAGNKWRNDVVADLRRGACAVLAVLAVLLPALLSACINGDPGLGNDATSDTAAAACPAPPLTPPTTALALAPGRFVFARQSIPESATQFVTQADAQGALGYRYNARYTLSDDPSLIYICDTANPARWAYRALRWIEGELNFAGLRDLLDEQGADGFRYRGRETFADGIFLTFVKNETRLSRFDYRLLTASLTLDDLLEQANEEGDAGYRFSERFIYSESESVEIYRRNVDAAQRLEYAMRAVASSPANFTSQVNELGTDGFRYWADRTLGSFEARSIFIKNLTTPGLYSTQTLPVPVSLARLIAQANEEGAQGSLRIDDGLWTAAGPQSNRTIFFNLNGCNCEPLELADPLVD